MEAQRNAAEGADTRLREGGDLPQLSADRLHDRVALRGVPEEEQLQRKPRLRGRPGAHSFIGGGMHHCFCRSEREVAPHADREMRLCLLKQARIFARLALGVAMSVVRGAEMEPPASAGACEPGLPIASARRDAT